MNERFQALADEAEEYADSVVDAGGEFHPAYTKKFAQLIVKECAKHIDSMHNGNFHVIADELKQHFGVES